jgi:homoserine dehydrogenase
MKQVRLSLVGFGVVGQSFAALLQEKRDLLRRRYDLDATLVSVASARHGFIYREVGLSIPTLLELASSRRPLREHPGIAHWSNTLDGLQATTADILIEVTPTNLRDAEPALSHIRAALSRGMHVITANKGPIALHAQELLALAHQQHALLGVEATVMAGTPVISTIREGMAGATIHAVRGILNGTTNYILSAMTAGRDYHDVLAEAQQLGYAESDPTADVEGYDTVAKTLILAALAFGEPLHVEQVQRQGITSVTREQVMAAAEHGQRVKLIASLRRGSTQGKLEASVMPTTLPPNDPLARVDDALNAITIETDTLAAVTIIGPGAGGTQTAQGLLADLIAISRSA